MRHTQRFLCTYAQESNQFRPGRHLLQAGQCRDKLVTHFFCAAIGEPTCSGGRSDRPLTYELRDGRRISVVNG